MNTVIGVNHVGVTLSGNTILDDITFDVTEGSIFTLVGPNGAGKSTLIRAMLGMLPHDGSIHVQGSETEHLSSLERARRVAYMPQLISTSSNFRVVDFVRMGSFPWNGLESSEACVARVEDALTQCHLDAFRDRTIQSLSGGERQRALLAQVMVQNTPILLLDEPTVFLDIHHQALFETIIVSLKEQGRTIVYISHDIFSAKRISTHIAALKLGRLLALGRHEEVLQLSVLSELFDMPADAVQRWFSQSWLGETPA